MGLGDAKFAYLIHQSVNETKKRKLIDELPVPPCKFKTFKTWLKSLIVIVKSSSKISCSLKENILTSYNKIFIYQIVEYVSLIDCERDSSLEQIRAASE